MTNQPTYQGYRKNHGQEEQNLIEVCLNSHEILAMQKSLAVYNAVSVWTSVCYSSVPEISFSFLLLCHDQTRYRSGELGREYLIIILAGSETRQTRWVNKQIKKPNSRLWFNQIRKEFRYPACVPSSHKFAFFFFISSSHITFKLSIDSYIDINSKAFTRRTGTPFHMPTPLPFPQQLPH